mgnify:FL=1
MKKKGTLSIEIDKITQCLEDIDGNQLETIAYKIEDVNTLKGYTKKTGWYVNWAKLYKEYNIFALALSNSPSVFQGLVATKNFMEAGVTLLHWAVANPKNNLQISKTKEYYGVGGHLFAIALLESLKAGFGGVVIGHPADKKLYEHYIESLGAKDFTSSALARNYEYTIILEGMEARELYEKYTFNEVKAEIS